MSGSDLAKQAFFASIASSLVKNVFRMCDIRLGLEELTHDDLGPLSLTRTNCHHSCFDVCGLWKVAGSLVLF